MKVKTGSIVQGRSIETELDELDGKHQWPDLWDTWTTAEQFTHLSAYADLMTVSYLSDAHMVAKEFADERMKKLVKVVNG